MNIGCSLISSELLNLLHLHWHQGELKKLYAQLEVYKTKKMENNNPHLQKKRSSRLRLGRSLIRRIAEIPESMSRQSSRKDKDPSGAGGTQKGSGSCLPTSESVHVIIRNETAKSPDIQKCVPVRDASLRNSSMKNSMKKRASETESIDTVPLFCKSVSAQNLAVDNNFLQPVSPRVQKSFSFTEMHRDHYPFSPTKSMMDTSHAFKTSPKDISYGKTNVKEHQTIGINISNQKHVSEQETLTPKRTSPPALLYVCPWEFASSLPSSSPSVAKGKSGLDSDVESLRPKPPISLSAPGSPYSFAKPVGHCGFSFQSATQTLLLAKGLVAKKGSGKYSNKNELSKDEGLSQQTRAVTPISAMKSMKKSPQAPIRSLTCVDSKPCLVKQAAIRVYPEMSARNVPPFVHLWKSESMEYENTMRCQNDGKQRLCLTPSIECTRPSWHQDTASLTVPRCRLDIPNKSCQQSSIADICPWEVQQPDQLQPKGFCNNDSNVKADSKQMQITSGDKGICPQESPGQASGINSEVRKATEQQSHTEEEIFPCSVKQDSAKSVSEAKKTAERVIYVNALPDTKKQSLERQETLRADVCPWETSNTHTNQEIICVDAYPWKSDAKLGKYPETIRSTESKSLTTFSPRHLLTKQLTSTADMDICPWDFSERFSCQRESKKLLKTDSEKPRDDIKKTTAMPYLLTKQLTSTAETCPWDFPESPPIVKEVYLMEPKLKDMGLASQASTTEKTDSSSQGAEETERPEGIALTKEAESVHAKICLWENITQESEQPVKSSKKQTPIYVNVDPLCTGEPEKEIQNNKTAYTDICPWESEQSPKSAQSQNYLQAHICPRDLEVSEKSQMQASVCVDVCPWEANSEQPVSAMDSMSVKREEDISTHTAQEARANRPLTRCDALCPWEMKEGSQASVTGHDNYSDIFKWEEPIAEEESDAEAAAEAFIFPPDL